MAFFRVSLCSHCLHEWAVTSPVSRFPSGPSNRSNSVSSLDLEGESVSELGAGPSGSNGVEALQLLEHEQGFFYSMLFLVHEQIFFLSLLLTRLTACLSSSATTQDNLDDKLRKFEIRDMMGLTDDRDISETVSETWSTDVLGSDFDPNMDEDRLQEIAGMAQWFALPVWTSTVFAIRFTCWLQVWCDATPEDLGSQVHVHTYFFHSDCNHSD